MSLLAKNRSPFVRMTNSGNMHLVQVPRSGCWIWRLNGCGLACLHEKTRALLHHTVRLQNGPSLLYAWASAAKTWRAAGLGHCSMHVSAKVAKRSNISMDSSTTNIQCSV